MKTKTIITDLVAKAMRSKTIGLTITDRVKLISGAQRNKVRLILLRSFRKGETTEQIVSKVKQFYLGTTVGGGPSYLARRLVQSELTRFNARVAIRMGELINEETGRNQVFVYHTQMDDRVRDTHAAQEGNEFASDEQADSLGLPAVSEAEALLEEPNCRCWLDVSYEGAPGKKVQDTSPKPKDTTPKETPKSDPDRKSRLWAALESGDRNSVLSAVQEYL